MLVTTRALRYAPLWGMLRSVALEHPEVHIRRVLLDETGSYQRSGTAELLDMASSILARDGTPCLDNEDDIMVTVTAKSAAGERAQPQLQTFVRRFNPIVDPLLEPLQASDAKLPSSTASPVAFREHGCYLITGGLRGIGLELAKWLATSTPVGCLLLLSRTKPSVATQRSLRKLCLRRSNLSIVTISGVSVADAKAMEILLHQLWAPSNSNPVASGYFEWSAGQQLSSTPPPLNGVFHCAGTVADGVLLRLSDERALHVLRPNADSCRGPCSSGRC